MRGGAVVQGRVAACIAIPVVKRALVRFSMSIKHQSGALLNVH
jgi:hypothetical protein